MNLLQNLQAAVESATASLRSKRAEAEVQAATASAEAKELEALVQRYEQLLANVERAKERGANCAAAFEGWLAGAREGALSNLAVGWESGQQAQHLAELARALAAEQFREEILGAFKKRSALYEQQLADFIDKHSVTLQRISVL